MNWHSLQLAFCVSNFFIFEAPLQLRDNAGHAYINGQIINSTIQNTEIIFIAPPTTDVMDIVYYLEHWHTLQDGPVLAEAVINGACYLID